MAVSYTHLDVYKRQVLGRCAEEVLADREGLISIFVRADLDFRVKRTPLPEEEALEMCIRDS